MNGKQTIKKMSLKEVMAERFSRYSKSIIQERALPDVRDGLKPVRRRILYAMWLDGNTSNKAYRKSAKAVGNVMGNFHPHGDSSIYEALINMSQSWKMRVPLIDLHGNNGSMDGDSPAAMRYTEARLSTASNEMMRDINKNTVSWVMNFDDTEYEPTVLPARFPNLIVNGDKGISSGYATNIPPHNLGETIDAVIYLQQHPNASLNDLMQFIKGPDFPTGGIIQGEKELKKAYDTGRGNIIVRARVHIVNEHGGKKAIKVTEIPYGVNKLQLVKSINSIRINHKINGIDMVEDDSDRHGLLITILLKRNADVLGTLNYLYKNTDLQIHYHFNVVAIDHMQPKLLSLKSMLQSYLEFQRQIVWNRTLYDYKQIQAKREIVKGYIKALSIIDKVIHLIRSSNGRSDASHRLESTLGFTSKQANAIVTLRLYRLTNTNITALQDEDTYLDKKAMFLDSILNTPQELDAVLRTELEQIKKKYSTPRRTSIQKHVTALHISKAVTVPDEDVAILVSNDGYVKRSSWRSYKASKNHNGLKPGDYPLFTAHMNTRNCLYMFTNLGRIIYRPINDIKEVRWKDTGNNITQSIKMLPHEKIRFVFGFEAPKDNGSFLIETNDGYIKRTTLKQIAPGRTYRHHAPIYIHLEHRSSRVVNVTYLPKSMPSYNVLLISKYGMALRFDINQVSISGAQAAGVHSMNLNKGDYVVNMQLVQDNDVIGMMTLDGRFIKLAVKDTPLMNRNRKGNHVLFHNKYTSYQLADFIKLNPVAEQQPLYVYTVYRRKQALVPAKYHVMEPNKRYLQIININKLGNPDILSYQ